MINKPKNLNKRQRLFVDDYCASGFKSALQSMLNAGYSKTYAQTHAKPMLENVSDYLTSKTRSIAAKHDVEVSEIIEGLRSIAFDDTTEKVNTGDRIRSLELLGKYKAMFVDKHVVSKDTGQQPAKELESAIDRSRARAIQINAHVRTVTPGEGGMGSDDIYIYPH